MAALNFPSSPTIGDIHTENGTSWKWNGTVWAGRVSSSLVDTTTNQTIGGEKIFSENAVFNDTANTMPNQLPETSDAIMTRGLSVKEIMFSQGVLRGIWGSGFNTSGTGTAAATDNSGFSVAGSTTASAWQRAANTRTITTNPGYTGGNNAANVPFAFATCGFIQMDATDNTEMRVVCGDAGSAAPPAFGSNRLTARGFGFVVYYSTTNARREVKLFAHDGTTYVESASGVAIQALSPSSWVQNLILSTNGAGTIKLFTGVNASGNTGGKRTDSTPILTLSGGPSTGTFGGPYLSTIIVNSATPPTGTISYRCINMMLHTGEIY